MREQPAQHIFTETPLTVQSEHQRPIPEPQEQVAKAQTPPLATEQQPDLLGSEPTKPLYNPKEVEQIVRHLTNGIFDPEYILLFGKLVGGTRFSDPMAYDLLIVVRETPSYDWIQAKRYLRYQMPLRHREITTSISCR